MMSIPSDTRRFSMAVVVWMTTSVALALAVSRLLVFRPSLLSLGVIGFWIACGFFLTSDLVDSRPVDDKCLAAQLLNILGIAMFCFSMLACIGCLAINAVIALPLVEMTFH